MELQALLNVVAPLVNNRENVNVDVSKQLLFTIWILAKPESFLAAGDRFDLAKSTGHQIFKNITGILAQIMPQYVKWPNVAERQISCNVCTFLIFHHSYRCMLKIMRKMHNYVILYMYV